MKTDLKAMLKNAVEGKIKNAFSTGEIKVEASSKSRSALVAVRFLKSPTGLFNLAYSAGDTGQVIKAQAKELIEAGYAEYLK